MKLVVGQPVGVPCRVESCAGFVRDEALDGTTLRAVVRAVDEPSAAWARTHLRPTSTAARR